MGGCGGVGGGCEPRSYCEHLKSIDRSDKPRPQL